MTPDPEPHELRCILAREYVWYDHYGTPHCFVKMITTWLASAPWWESKGYAVLFREPEPAPQFNPPRITEEHEE